MLDKIPMIETLLFEKYKRRVYIDGMKVYVDDIEIARIEIASMERFTGRLVSDRYTFIDQWYPTSCEAVVAGYELAKCLLLNNDI